MVAFFSPGITDKIVPLKTSHTVVCEAALKVIFSIL